MVKKEYSNGEVTIVWKPENCIHSGKCVQGLPSVFNPKEKPWINVTEANTQELVNQVKTCPSGALSYYMNNDPSTPEEVGNTATKVEVLKNGPLLVHGTLELKDADGNIVSKENRTSFCRCGASGNKPFCDGSHRKIGFED